MQNNGRTRYHCSVLVLTSCPGVRTLEGMQPEKEMVGHLFVAMEAGTVAATVRFNGARSMYLPGYHVTYPGKHVHFTL